jgi:hypothetical protein
MNDPAIVYIWTVASVLLRRGAERLGVDTSDDSGFTTVEKVVLTGFAVLLAGTAAFAMRRKIEDLLSKISTDFG